MAPDGSPVAVYLAMPAGEAPTIIHQGIAAGADILELGAGVGRLTRVLIAYGHDVVAVDDHPEMLSHITGAETVLADLYELDLGRRFGAVVAASHLINRVDPADRARLLEVCARHVAPGGDVLIERYPPAWAAQPSDTSGRSGPVDISVTIHGQGPAGFSATAAYQLADRAWRQHFEAVHVDDDALATAASNAGMELVGWLDAARTWGHVRSVQGRR